MSSPSSRAATEGDSRPIKRTTDASAGGDSPLEDAPETSGGLPKDLVFELLSVQRRRDVLTYLDEVERETTLSDLAEHVAAKENGIGVRHLSAAQRKRVYVGLYQCHLPKMADANVIDFNQARGTIELRAEAQQLFPYLYLDLSHAMLPPSKEAAGSRLLHGLTTLLKGRILG